MRITGGSHRGRPLVPWDASGIRPMRDFVRSALYNILGDLVRDARFLDLFCGTGSVGLDALSRGAAGCVFVDLSEDACGIVRRNLDQFDFLDRAEVVSRDFTEAIDHLERRGHVFDLVFAGPPYGRGLAPAALRRLGDSRLIAADGMVITEVFRKEQLDSSYGRLSRIRERAYGDNALWFYAADPEAESPGEPGNRTKEANLG